MGKNVYHSTVRSPVAKLVILVLCVGAAAVGCTNPLVRQYEYDEQTYLEVDGSATVIVSASVASLIALRGLAFDPAPNTRLDSNDVRQLFEAAGCDVERVSRPWRRHGRRFVQAQIHLDDVREAGTCGALAWSTYTFDATEHEIRYTQLVGGAPGTPGLVPPDVGWNGSEVVGFKLHLPSRVTYQNVRRLDDGEIGSVERGNILTWEQYLSDRVAGVPIAMEVRTEAQSILYRTVWLFGAAFAAAVGVLIVLIWYTMRRGRARLRTFRQ